jgi:hypothetical protein
MLQHVDQAREEQRGRAGLGFRYAAHSLTPQSFNFIPSLGPSWRSSSSRNNQTPFPQACHQTQYFQGCTICFISFISFVYCSFFYCSSTGSRVLFLIFPFPLPPLFFSFSFSSSCSFFTLFHLFFFLLLFSLFFYVFSSLLFFITLLYLYSIITTHINILYY